MVLQCLSFSILGKIGILQELVILISVGMKRMKLIMILCIETFMVSFVGVVVGIVISIPMVFYLVNNPIRLVGEMAELYEKLSIEPILSFSAEPVIFISQAVVVFLIALVTILYPLLYIRRLDPARTIRG